MAKKPTLENSSARGGATQYLNALAQHVRNSRVRGGMTRRKLALAADVSERYLGQLENGKGNISILLLRQIATALNVRLVDLVSDSEPQPPEVVLMAELMKSLGPEDRRAAYATLETEYGKRRQKDRRIALIGMRGAGKSTLGKILAEHSGLKLISLQSEIERRAGLDVEEIYALSGAKGYSRFEYAALVDVLSLYSSCVIEVGGAVVHDPKNFELLLRTCYTVWIRTEPEDHLRRVLAKGDRISSDIMLLNGEDVRQIWDQRQPFYSKADATIDTYNREIKVCAQELIKRLETEFPSQKPRRKNPRVHSP